MPDEKRQQAPKERLSERDAYDRRKVIIQTIPERLLPKLTPVFLSLQQGMGAEFASLYTDHEMALILDFIERSMRVLQSETAKLRAKGSQEERVEQASVNTDETM